jgi:hypothetical protein
MASEHTHTFDTKTEKVMLYKHVFEDGRTKNLGIEGYDLLTIRYCTAENCSYQEVLDGERMIA